MICVAELIFVQGCGTAEFALVYDHVDFGVRRCDRVFAHCTLGPPQPRAREGRTALLRGAHYPPIAALVRLGQIDKLISSFGPTLAAQVSPVTGRLHPSYHTAGAKSGRATVSSPPVQQVPRDLRYRQLFRAAPGNVLVGADFVSMELRVACWIAADQVMTRVFEQGLDLHTTTAAAISGKRVGEIDADGEDQDNAKRVHRAGGRD
jgi:DNA polymerase I